MHAFPIENLFVSLMLVNNTYLNCTNTTTSNAINNGQESATPHSGSFQGPPCSTDCLTTCVPYRNIRTTMNNRMTTCTIDSRSFQKSTCTTKKCIPKKTITTSTCKTSTPCVDPNSTPTSPLCSKQTTCNTQDPSNFCTTPLDKCDTQSIHHTPAAYIIKSYGIHGKSSASEEQLGRNQTDGLRLIHEILCIPKQNKSHLSSGVSKLQKLPRTNQWERKEISFPVMSTQYRQLQLSPQTKTNQFNRANQNKNPGPLLIHVLQKAKALKNAPDSDIQQMPLIQTIRVPEAIHDDDLESIVNSIRAQLNKEEAYDTKTSDRAQPAKKNLASVMTVQPRNIESLRSLHARYNGVPEFTRRRGYHLREPSLELNRDSWRKQFVTGVYPYSSQQREKISEAVHPS